MNAALLAVILMGMTFTMLWGARGLVGGGDDGQATDILSGADENAEDDGGAPDSNTTSTTSTTIAPETTTTTAAEPATTVAVTHVPSEVKARVGNGAERGGVAGEGTNLLAAAGFATLSPKNADIADVSTIYYLPGYSEDAKVVAELLNVSEANVFPLPDNLGMPVGDAMVVALMGKDTSLGR